VALVETPSALVSAVAAVFNPDIYLHYPSYVEMVTGVAAAIPESRRALVTSFLCEALEGEHSDEELRDVWRKANSDDYVWKSEWCRLFLEDVRLQLAGGKVMQ
jgi:hypothetical protein